MNPPNGCASCEEDFSPIRGRYLCNGERGGTLRAEGSRRPLPHLRKLGATWFSGQRNLHGAPLELPRRQEGPSGSAFDAVLRRQPMRGAADS